MDLDGAAADLYQISPEDFVERRKQLTAEARAAGDRELARQIGRLRRPTRTAWLVNSLAHRQPERLSELFELGAQLSDAQRRLAGDDLRKLSARRRTLIDTLSRQAVDIGHELGYSAPDGTFQEISQTLQAALGDHDVATLVQQGTLTQGMVYGGFGSDDLAAALAASTTAAAPRTEPDAEPAPADQDQQPAEDPALAAERERLRAAAADAQAAAEEAEQAAEQATAHADELADRVESLRSELREAEAAERDARSEARSARKQLTELRQAAAQAAADAAVAQT